MRQEVGRVYIIRMQGAAVRSVGVIVTEVGIEDGVQVFGPVDRPEQVVTDLTDLQNVLGESLGAAQADVQQLAAALSEKEAALVQSGSALAAEREARIAAEGQLTALRQVLNPAAAE